MSYKQYQSHKVVLATAILSVASVAAQKAIKAVPATEAGEGIPAVPEIPAQPAVAGGFSYTLEDQEVPLFVALDDPMIARYQPTQGDYLVVYPDGYRAFSPKQAFEDGYALLDRSAPQAVPADQAPPQSPAEQATVIMSNLERIAGHLGDIADAQKAMLDQAKR